MARRKLKPEPTIPATDVASIDMTSSQIAPVEFPIAHETPANASPTPTTAAHTTASEPASETAAAPEADAPTKNYGPNPFGIRSDLVAGVRLQEDKRYRQMQLKFDSKPTDEVRQAVRDAGFQWRSQEQVWSKQIDPDQGWRTRAAAETVFEQVTALIRAEQGHTQSVG